MMSFKIFSKQNLVSIIFFLFTYLALSQSKDSVKEVTNVKAAVSITNNEFSFMPSFTLGKPALIINLGIGGKRLSFEPELRFALEGKP
jgi:hypothetical protein